MTGAPILFRIAILLSIFLEIYLDGVKTFINSSILVSFISGGSFSPEDYSHLINLSQGFFKDFIFLNS
jgi:hypothetical protein